MPLPENDWDPKGLWAVYTPDEQAPWDLRRVVHLHRRAGFAATWGELKRDLRDGPAASIDRVLKGEATSGDATPAAEFEATLDSMARDLAAYFAWSDEQLGLVTDAPV